MINLHHSKPGHVVITYKRIRNCGRYFQSIAGSDYNVSLLCIDEQQHKYLKKRFKPCVFSHLLVPGKQWCEGGVKWMRTSDNQFQREQSQDCSKYGCTVAQ